MEEVRAELFAALAGRMLGLDYDIRQHVSYLDFWSGGVAQDSRSEAEADEGPDRSKVIRSVLQDIAPIVAGLQSFMVGDEPDLK